MIVTGANLNETDDAGRSPLFRACVAESGCPGLNFTGTENWNGIVRFLVQHCNCDVNSPVDEYGDSPFMTACWNGNLDMVRFLLENGAVPIRLNQKNDETPLFNACNGGSLDVVALLIKDHGLDVNHKNKSDETPLSVAFRNGHVDVAMCLLDNGATLVTPEPKTLKKWPHVQRFLRILHSTQPAGPADEWRRTTTRLEIEELQATKAHLFAERDRLKSELAAQSAATKAARLAAEEVAATKARKVAQELDATRDRLEADLAATKARLVELDALKELTATSVARFQREERQKLDAMRARELDAMEAARLLEADLAATKAHREVDGVELKRWRDGELTCEHVVDVETGTVIPTTVEVAPPSRKRARQHPSMLSQLVDVNTRAVRVKTEAAEVTSRLEDELETTTLCVICVEKPRDVVFTGCGHFLACGACADRLLAQHGGSRKRTQAPCPSCRQPIKSILSCVLV